LGTAGSSLRMASKSTLGVGRGCALVGECAGAKYDDALHSGDEDQFRLVPLAGRQRAPLCGNVADVVPHVEWRGLRVLIHRSLLLQLARKFSLLLMARIKEPWL